MAVVGQLYAPAVLPPGKELLVTIEQEAVWVPDLARTLWRRQNSVVCAGNRTVLPDVRCTDEW